MVTYTFEVLGGKTNKNGKNHWPCVLQILMSQEEALKILSNIAHQCSTLDKGQVVIVGKCGKMTKEIE